MEIPVLVEPVANNGYRAISGEPLRLEAEAPTRAEAIAEIQRLFAQRIQAGAEVVSVSVGEVEHPLAKYAGMLKDDPMLEEWKEAMKEYREQREKEEE